VQKAYLLARPDETLKVKQGDGIEISLPAQPVDPIATVIVLEVG
jgi:hypothetical protein